MQVPCISMYCYVLPLLTPRIFISAPAHLVDQQIEFLNSFEHIGSGEGNRIVAKGNETIVPNLLFLVYGTVVPAEENYDFLISANHGVQIDGQFKNMIIEDHTACTMRLEIGEGRFCSGVIITIGGNVSLPFSIMFYTFVLPRKKRRPVLEIAVEVDKTAEAAKDAYQKAVAEKCRIDAFNTKNAERRRLERAIADQTKQINARDERLRVSRSNSSRPAEKERADKVMVEDGEVDDDDVGAESGGDDEDMKADSGGDEEDMAAVSGADDAADSGGEDEDMGADTGGDDEDMKADSEGDR